MPLTCESFQCGHLDTKTQNYTPVTMTTHGHLESKVMTVGEGTMNHNNPMSQAVQ